MNNRFKAFSLSGLMVIASFVAKPALADEWNKRTEFQFSGPVQIPGKVLTAGKYVFQLADSPSDRNIVQVFSQDANGSERLVATILAIPDYIQNTPDKPIVHFEERAAGTPEAIHSWYYPGDNTGWEFVYPAVQASSVQPSEVSTNSTPAPAPAPVGTPAAAMIQPESPQVRELEARDVEEEVAVAQEETPATTVADAEADSAPAQVLPETGGSSVLVFLTGLTMLFAGVLTRFSARRKAQL
jgi:hypothetical protein